MSGWGGQDPKISRSLGGFFFDMDGTMVLNVIQKASYDFIIT